MNTQRLEMQAKITMWINILVAMVALYFAGWHMLQDDVEAAVVPMAAASATGLAAVVIMLWLMRGQRE